MKKTNKIALAVVCFLLIVSGIVILTSCGGVVENFNLSFKVDGDVYQTMTTTGAESISIPQNPTKEGYTFDGWYWDKDEWNEPFTANSLLNAPISSDMSVYAKFNAISYDITYETDGGTHENPLSYTIEDGFTLSPAEKLGYTFIGWYLDEEYTTEATAIEVGSTGAFALYAKFEIESYTVSYENLKGQENTNPTSYDVESETITLSPLSKVGYIFEGWYNGSERVTEIAQGSTGNITLIANWTPIGYEITYHNVEGATNNNAPTYDVEDEPLALHDASKIGYTFLGWYDVNDNKMNEIPVGTIGNLDLYAKWETIEYTATFMDGEDEVDKITFTVETESLEEPGVPEHIGYTGIWESYTLGLENITINAVYTPIVYTITYEETKGADNPNPVTYTIESDTITLDDISVNGYTFDGWTKDGKEVTEITQGSTGNIVLTANWTAIKYSITYMYDSAIGDYADTSKNPATYTIEDDFDFIALVNKTTGYTFGGWYTEKNVGTGTKVNGIEAGSTGDITIYAQWALDEYIITYHNANGITNTNATTYTVETDTFEIFDISKNGYTFGGWYSDSEFGTKITEIAKGTTGNIDLYAKWTPVEYTIEYVLYGGTYAEGISNPIKYTIEDKITFASPSLDGYTFVGFFTLAEGGVRVTGVENGTVGNKTLYARYVAFDTNGGSDIEYELTISGNKMSMPTEPKMDYYTFDGWYTDEALTKKFDFSIPTKTFTLYAKFEPTVYKITYVLNGGTNPQNQVLEYTVENTLVTLLNPTKTGYTFVGWFTDDKFTSSVVTELKNEHGDKTFYANYSINKYTISFNTNAGTEVEPITQNYQTSVSAPSSPAKNGYKFEGWYSDSALKNKYTFTTMPAKDITLYAKWSLENYKITYNLEGGANNKNNPSSFTVESNDITLQSPTKTGYKFVGWYSDSAYRNAVTKIAKGTYTNVELFAKWEIITYTITYNVNGATHSNPTTYTVETDLAYLADATLKGHTFGGWYKESAYSTRVYQIGGGETGNITLYAKFTANTYDVYLDGTDEASFDVSFDLNGASGSIATQTITESNTLKYPSVPTRDGYVFGGWYADKDCTGNLYDFTALITSDITLYAKWVKTDNSIAVNSNVTVNLNGREEQKFTFVPLVNGNVTFTTTGTYDTLGILYDEGGNVLKLDDDTGSDGINFQIVFNVTAGEIYTISVSSYSSATNGTSTLYVSGSNTVNAGGYVITGNKAEATYGQSFTLPVPSARDGYKFLGYADKNGTMYTDGTGASVKAWDKDEATLLVSVWERTVYTVTFVTSGGSELDPVELAFGDRLDISKYVTTRANYTFDCWMYDGAEFEATTMPDHNITLTAKWKTFALGEIKYDTTKLAVSVNDEITADLFGALCLDTNGQKAEFTVAVSGTQEVGETISVRLVAKSGNKTKQVTITGVQVYGAPTLDFNSTVDYVNLVGGMTASHFNASGTDSFGNATKIKVYIEGDYKAGDIVKVTIESIDLAGNVTKGYVENVKAYGLPDIIYNEEKTAISVNDTLNAALFGATAKDSFGNDLTVTVSKYSGTISAGNMVTIRISAIDSKGNVKNIDVSCKVYGKPTISNATKTNIKVTDNITATLLGITAKDTYNQVLDIEISVKSGEQKAGTTMVVTATATDIAGNVTTKDITLKVYGTPTISYNRDSIKVSENPENDSTVLNAIAKDSFGVELSVTAKLQYPCIFGRGEQVVYVLTATDIAGNTYSMETALVGIYDVSDIEESFTYNEYMSDLAKLSSNGSEFDASATDSFGNACTITIESANGSALAGGQTTSIVLVATDKAGNRVVSEPIDNIRIFDMPTIEIDEWLTEDTDIEFMATVYDSFGNELYAEITYEGNQVAGETVVITVKATDDAGNELNVTYAYVVHIEEAHTPSDWIVDKEADRCMAGEQHKECTVCEKVLETGTIAAPDKHAYENGYCTVCGAKQPYTRVDEDTILFGTYPQTEVTNSTLKSTLNSLAGRKPTSSNSYNWTSYGYYVSGSVSNYMWYIDIENDGEKYRGVYFTSNRLNHCSNQNISPSSPQKDNGYTTGIRYWFKYEPISWTILNESDGTAFILCDMIIDSQQFDYLTNDYAESTIRKWLNETFYETAFDELQREIIITTTVDNSTESTGYINNPYVCEDTQDKVFLLSRHEAYKYVNSTTRQKKTTDYAKSQGVISWTSYGNGSWWLRSPGNSDRYSAIDIDYGGQISNFYCDVYYTYMGVVPALNIQLI